MQLVGKNDDNLMSTKLLIDNSKHLHWWAIFEFWKLLSEMFVDMGFSIIQRIENEMIDDLVHGSTAKRNKAFFNLELSTPDGIQFTINSETDDDICVVVSNENVNKSGQKSQVKAFFRANKEFLNLRNSENWPFYKNIDFANSRQMCLGAISDELTFSLVSEKCKKEIVDTIIKQTQELLKCYKRSLK